MVAEFKASLMHVLEAICQQTELVLQHYAEMLRTLLPAVCEVRLGDGGLEFSRSFPASYDPIIYAELDDLPVSPVRLSPACLLSLPDRSLPLRRRAATRVSSASGWPLRSHSCT